eukprot:gene34276-biopygen23631
MLTRFELAGGCGALQQNFSLFLASVRDSLRVADKLAVSVSVPGPSPFARDAWGGALCTSWEAQQSSRQWEPGWEANVAEQDEILPHTVLDELQPLGTTTVTRDDAAWLDPESNATFGGHPDFKEEHWEEIRAVLRRCKDCFANIPHDLKGYTGKATHNTFSIPFKDESKAVYQRPRKYTPGEQEIIDIHCKELLEYGFIEPASKHCRHASNVVVAGKKDHTTGLWTQPRFCCDLRAINRQSLKDNTLPHRPEDLYQKVAKAKFKTTLDAAKAFVIRSPWPRRRIGARRRSGGRTSCTATVDFLGYRIFGHNSIGAQEAKCKAIQDLPRPQDKTGHRSILGMMNYYKGLVDIKGAWGTEQDHALHDLKDALCFERCLRPIDYDSPLILYTDWSTYGIGAVLDQKDDSLWRRVHMHGNQPISEQDREAVQYASFKDHSPLTTLMEKSDLQGQHLRWAISLQEFDFTVQYRPGAKNINADVPSRYPLPSTTDETGARHDREDTSALHAGVGEFCAKSFCDSLCFTLAGDPPIGVEATPEVQIANYCKIVAREQLGTGPVHRLFDLHYQEELECHHTVLFDTDQPELVVDSGRLARAAWKALSLVRPTRGTHGEGTPAVYSSEHFEGESILKPEKVDTRVLDKQFFSRARDEGVACYEPCGSLCAGLEMLLHSGMKMQWSWKYSVPGDLRATTMADLIRAGTEIRDEVFPYIAGVIGQPVSFDAARAGFAGADSEEETREVNLEEKSRAMGYSASELRMAGGLSDEELASILGLAMDRRAMELLLAVAEASRKGLPHSEESPVPENSPGQPIAVDNNWADHASVAEQHADRDKHRAMHDDEWCLRWLKSNGNAELAEGEARRVKRRAARHRWYEVIDEIYMITLSDKEARIPKPADRLALVREYHARTGHWGIRRTQYLLWQRYWWADLKKDVEAVVTQCETCQRVKTHYAREEAFVSPLEIKSFMYRWSLDLAWPSRRMTRPGNSRVLIMTEHYTRFIVCVPIPNKEASTIAAAFYNHVLAVFGAPAECLVDGGKEFDGEFQQLSRDCLIDRRVTSPDSPEGNGLTERVESTGVAPFTLLFAQEAVVPPDLKHASNLDFDLEAAAWKSHNIEIPYFMKAEGVVDMSLNHTSSRLMEKSTVQSIAPCHLQVKDPYDCSAAVPSKHLAREVCRKADGEAEMLLCDTCNKGYHLWCLTPALSEVPEGEWLCPRCSGTGMQAAHAEVATQESKASRVLEDRLGMKNQRLNEKLSTDMEEKDLFRGMPDQVDWGKQDKLSEMVRIFMPGHWNEGHRTVLSKKYREQKAKARQLRNAPLVP